MGRKNLLIVVLLLTSVSMAVYSLAVSTGSVSQAGGSGIVDVQKVDVRVLGVSVAANTIDSATVTVSSSVSGTYLVEVFVTVGGCSSYGSTSAFLSTAPTQLAIQLNPSCPYDYPAQVRVRVTQP
uniref:Uncharacterized protein n=1 Tax=Caldiarchaeum subterraneum TaxID=311458 RepID=A0A7J3VUN5_CALS0